MGFLKFSLKGQRLREQKGEEEERGGVLLCFEKIVGEMAVLEKRECRYYFRVIGIYSFNI